MIEALTQILIILHVGINSYILGVNNEDIPKNKFQALCLVLFLLFFGWFFFAVLRLGYELKHSKRFADLRFWIDLNFTSRFANLSDKQIRRLERDKHENVSKQWVRVKKKYGY